jgi:HAD superfamily hydrolase (TIGR01549 family)
LSQADPESKGALRQILPVKAVMFDLDDTLIHSTIDFTKLKRKTIDFYSSFGISPDALSPTMTTHEILQKATSMLRTKGYTPREILRIIRKTSGLWDHIELEHVTGTRAVDGAKDTLAHLKKQNYEVGVITRSCRRYALKTLQITGLLEFIDLIVARNECEKDKPDPEPLVQAMRAVSSKAEETVMVGDSITDYHCATNAGVRFIGIDHGADRIKTLKRTTCIAIIHDLRDLIDLFI